MALFAQSCWVICRFHVRKNQPMFAYIPLYHPHGYVELLLPFDAFIRAGMSSGNRDPLQTR